MKGKKELKDNYQSAKHFKEYLDEGKDIAILPLDGSGVVVRINYEEPIYRLLKAKIDGFVAMAEAFVSQVEEK